MKKINIFLTSVLAFLSIGCSGKFPVTPSPQINTSAPRTVHRPQVVVQPTNPSLGRPISVPPATEVRTIEPVVTPPRRDAQFRVGESYVRKKFRLPSVVKESSGLIKVDNRLWTMNDSGGKPELYQIDEKTGRIVKTFRVTNASNRDWEDIAYDDNYVYIGDFGNNKGNSKSLKVYKIPRAALRSQKSARAEVISFSFSDQKDFTSRPQKTNYDCEAMVAYHGKLYLFSKDWGDQKTRLYELSASAGKHVAKYISTFNTHGMVTGASVNKELDLLILTTYSPLLNVNVWVFKNFRGENFFRGDAKKLHLHSPLAGQVEGVTFTGNYKAYLSSEAFKKYIFSFDPALYSLDFSREFE